MAHLEGGEGQGRGCHSQGDRTSGDGDDPDVQEDISVGGGGGEGGSSQALQLPRGCSGCQHRRHAVCTAPNIPELSKFWVWDEGVGGCYEESLTSPRQ